MSELFTKLAIATVVALFLAACIRWVKPVSDCGKLSRKMCFVNALGWVVLLPLSGSGHPPPVFFPALLFWLINLPLLPATAVALRVCRQSREENGSYLAIASVYVALNALALFVLPLAWLIVEARR